MPVAPRNPVTRWTCLRCGWSTLVHERSDCLTVPRPRCRRCAGSGEMKPSAGTALDAVLDRVQRWLK